MEKNVLDAVMGHMTLFGQVAQRIKEKLSFVLSETPGFIFKSIIVAMLIYIWPKFIDRLLGLFRIALQKTGVDELIESFIESVLKILLYVMLILIVLGIFGVEATALLTVLGTAGLAVGLALQGSLSNLAGGVLILIFKPFAKGNLITVGEITGVVHKIQMLYTTITTMDHQEVIIPNSQISNSAITNMTKNQVRRVDMMFSVGYNSSIADVKRLLTEIADNHDLVLSDKGYTIRLLNHNASSLDFVCRVWTKTENYWTVKFDFMEIVKEVFDENNIEIPYQKIDIYQK